MTSAGIYEAYLYRGAHVINVYGGGEKDIGGVNRFNRKEWKDGTYDNFYDLCPVSA